MGEDYQVDLLISILVRFPQVGTVHFEPESKTLRLVFLIRDGHQDFQQFVERFDSHLAAFHKLSPLQITVASLKKVERGSLTMIEVVRDLASLRLAELNLIVELISDYYGDAVIREGEKMELEDEKDQNILIESLLMSGSWRSFERLTGFRERGRVLVYSIPLGVSER